MRQICVLAVALAALVCAAPHLAAGETLDVELEYAKGLADLGYYKSADMLLGGLDWQGRESEEERRRIVAAIADNSFAWAEAVETQLQALERMREADTVASAFLQTGPSPEIRDEMNEKLGYILLERGARARNVFRRQTSGVDLDAVAKDASESFQRAAEAFGKAKTAYRTRVDAIESKRDINDEDRKARAELLPKLVVVETQMGWAHYRRAELYQDMGDEAAHKREIEAAAELFKAQMGAHERILAGYSAALGYGLCLQETGKHKEAIEAFDKAVRVERSESTNIIRFQALYQTAISHAETGDHESAIQTMSAMRREYPRLPSFLEDAWQMNYGRFFGQYADTIRARENELQKAIDELREKRPEGWIESVERTRRQADELRKRATENYEKAMRAVRDIAEGDSEYAQEASLLLGQWAAAAGIERMRSATDYFAQGERLYQAGELEEAIGVYRQAIVAADGRGAGRNVARDAWIQMGKAYSKLNRHYEAGLVFGLAARLYSESEYAENLAIYSSMLLGHVYEKGKTDLEAAAYFDAQHFLVNNFPHNDPARRAAFRLGDVQRARENYAEAAEFYSKVDRASTFYERARYLAGQCLWKAATSEGVDRIDKDLAEASEALLEEFVSWAEEQPSTSAQEGAERVEWIGKSRLLLAEMLYEQGRHGDVVASLDEDKLGPFLSRPDLVGAARVMRVKAYCAEGGASSARLAGAEMQGIRESEALGPEVKSAAAQLVGTTFLAAAARAGAESPAKMFQTAREYLVMAIDLKPEAEIADYEEAASSLRQAGAHNDAAHVFQLIVERYRDSAAHAEAVRDARHWVGRCYRDAGDMGRAAEQFASLVEDYPRSMDIRKDLALAYESEGVARYGDAERHWRAIEDTLAMGTGEWFEARYHRVKNLAMAGRAPLAFQILASTRVPYPGLGGEAMKTQFETVVKDHFPQEQQEAYQALAQELGAGAQ